MAARRASVLGLLLLLPLLPSASSSSMVFTLDGNVYPDGHLYVTVNIGEKEKEKPYFLDIDTGSNLSWLECDAGKGTCETCNKVPHPLYQVISKKLVPCARSLCNVVHGDLGTNKTCRDGPDQCGYDIHKFDGSRTLGVLLVDKFSFPMGHGSSARSDIAFGCGYNQVKKGNKRKVAVDGILGLGRGSVDLVSQLKR
ncbi:hypothetical protein EJB05_28723 [Eragrostis curvula]|uniref:Peptidase A1 domain-containing protein n=1 Tax=Eragrostis curvula TaxID=38414 RepID=A0A5J9USR9_9POAL|nr:hypothetical protein EJB05_28723 [Eragrostis curvula]